jgi:hypothetical protein
VIHPDANDPDLRNEGLYEEAQRAFIAAHPHRDHRGQNNDLAAIEWRHGYITGRRAARTRLNLKEEQ